jgi:nucleotide-binding universal stress UspA family protein
MQISNFRSILCPVDFSELSAHALRYAAALARCGGAEVTVLYANSFEAPPYFTESRLEELQRQFREAKEEADRGLRGFVEGTLGEGASSIRTRVVEALPADAIRQLSTEMRADLVVMGTHGRSGFNRWMLGSVVERVLRDSQVPVLTVRGAALESIRHVLCPVNDTEISRRAWHVAVGIAACFDATVTALHVHEDHTPNPIGNLCAWIAPEERAHCEVRELVRRGEAAQEIVALAAEIPCDLLVLGSQHQRFFDSSILGTTTIRTVRHAPCPVLTVIGAG